MSTEKYDFYKFFIDIGIPFIVFLIGLFTEKKWKITNKFRIFNNQKISVGKNKGNQNLSQQQAGRDAHSLSLQQQGDKITNQFNFEGKPDIGDSHDFLETQPKVEQSISYSNQAFIIKSFQENAEQLQINAQFEQKYKSTYEWLKEGNAQACAAEYFKIFRNIVSIFEQKEIYTQEMPKFQSISDLKKAFKEIEQFMYDSQKNVKELQDKIDNFEDVLISLLGNI